MENIDLSLLALEEILGVCERMINPLIRVSLLLEEIKIDKREKGVNDLLLMVMEKAGQVGGLGNKVKLKASIKRIEIGVNICEH